LPAPFIKQITKVGCTRFEQRNSCKASRSVVKAGFFIICTTGVKTTLDMKNLEQITALQLSHWVNLAQAQASSGVMLSRIAPLANANPNRLALHICTRNNALAFGDTTYRFPLMSVIKPFLWLASLHHHGSAAVAHWVGIQPSNLPFNSLAQLQADDGHPRNPMINSGAIALADRLPGSTATERCTGLCEWLNHQAGCRLSLDETLLAAVRQSDRSANLALLTALGQTLLSPNLALDTYEQICCLSGQISDLAQLGYLLTLGQIPAHQRQLIQRVMLTCGLYEASSRYAAQISLPIKSGVSGAILALVPQQGAIACYSPPLDAVGNSVAGLKLIALIAQALKMS
jgi:glutaminase